MILFNKHKGAHVSKRFTFTLITKLKNSMTQNKAIQFLTKQVKQENNIKYHV